MSTWVGTDPWVGTDSWSTAHASLRKDIDSSKVPGLVGRWRASDLTLTTGTAVSSWPSVVGPNAMQGTAAAQPTHNGLTGSDAAVRFDGVDDWMRVDLASEVYGVNTLTAYVVLKESGPQVGGNRRILGCGSPTTSNEHSSPNHFLTMFSSSTSITGYRSGAAFNPAVGVTTDEKLVHTIRFNGAAEASQHFKNGAAAGSRAGYADNFTFPAIHFGSNPVGTENAKFHLLEVLFYTTAHTAEQRAEVHSYIQDRYGVTVSDYVPMATATATTDSGFILPSGKRAPVRLGDGRKVPLYLGNGLRVGGGTTPDTFTSTFGETF